jgi:hypothetical protein
VGPGDAPTFTRTVPASIFHDAPRFHSGIGPGERAAIIEDTESVLTPGQMRQLSPSSAAPIVMNDNRTINIGAGASPQTVADLKQAFAADRAARFADTVAIVKRAQSSRHL